MEFSSVVKLTTKAGRRKKQGFSMKTVSMK